MHKRGPSGPFFRAMLLLGFPDHSLILSLPTTPSCPTCLPRYHWKFNWLRTAPGHCGAFSPLCLGLSLVAFPVSPVPCLTFHLLRLPASLLTRPSSVFRRPSILVTCLCGLPVIQRPGAQSKESRREMEPLFIIFLTEPRISDMVFKSNIKDV